MNIVKTKPLDAWRSCAGMCIICGTPLGLHQSPDSHSGGGVRKQADFDFNHPTHDAVITAKDIMIMNEGVQVADELWDDPTTIHHGAIEEDFIRVALFKYSLLGGMEACHIIDQYTYLKPKDSAGFRKVLNENKSIIEALGGNFLVDAFENGNYEKAADYCQRVAAKRVVPGCRACNSAMNRSNALADIVYRCFPPTATLHIPELEDSTSKTGRVISKGNVIKKLIQQIALFFTPHPFPSSSTSHGASKVDQGEATAKVVWKAKDESLIMLDAAVWRCVANLCMWGKSGNFRFALIGIFYAAVYIFERLRMADMILFNDWHLHVFRIFYMTTYAPRTWFGMTQMEASITFDTTKKDGVQWCNAVTGMYMDAACDLVDTFFTKQVNMVKIGTFKDLLTAHVYDEKSMFILLSKKYGPKEGITTLLRFFMYNTEDPTSALLKARALRFMKEIKPIISRELQRLIRQPSDLLLLES